MSDLNYTPTFHHPPWIDNVSRVKAGGPDGFNVRFEAIESDLHQVSTVVDSIDTLIDAVAAGPEPGSQRLLVPLDPTSEVNTPGEWICDITGALHAPPDASQGSRSTVGSMDLGLPDGATVISMRAIGLNQDGTANISIGLQRTSLHNIGLSAQVIASIGITPPGRGNPYNVTANADPAFAVVNNDDFHYAIVLFATSVSVTNIVSVDSVELVYTLP